MDREINFGMNNSVKLNTFTTGDFDKGAGTLKIGK